MCPKWCNEIFGTSGWDPAVMSSACQNLPVCVAEACRNTYILSQRIHGKLRSQHGRWSSEHAEDLCGDHLPGFNGTLCRYDGLPLVSHSHMILILLLGLERAQTGEVSTGWPVWARLPQICFLLLYGLLLFIWFWYSIVHIYTTVLLKPQFWLVGMWLLL